MPLQAEARPAEDRLAATSSEPRTPLREPAPFVQAASPLAPATIMAADPSQAPGPVHTVARLAADIAARLEGRSTRFEVELAPEGLGRVEVKLEIGASGVLSAGVRCEDPASAELLRARAHELKAQLQQAGFDLSGGLSFTSGGDREAHGRSQPRAFAPPFNEPAPTAAHDPVRPRLVRSGGVDLRI
jgi:flagellar hook-length control protein FliK